MDTRDRNPAGLKAATDAGLVLPSPRAAARALWRAARLRCPNCGGGPVLVSWTRLREDCPRCGLRTQRGEHDYFLGAMMFNIVLAEGLFATGLVVALLATWPEVPWDVLEIGAPIAMVAAPFILLPFSRLVWLAFDIVLRPPTSSELRSSVDA